MRVTHRLPPYCAGCAQNPLMHLLLVSQQFADVTHLSETPEHVGGVLEHTSPPSPPDSQYPLQHCRGGRCRRRVPAAGGRACD